MAKKTDGGKLADLYDRIDRAEEQASVCWGKIVALVRRMERGRKDVRRWRSEIDRIMREPDGTVDTGGLHGPQAHTG